MATKTRTLDNTGTCPICERNIKLDKSGYIVDHGYKLTHAGQWLGWRMSSCYGTGYWPYERSREGVVDYLAKVLHAAMRQLRAAIGALPTAYDIPDGVHFGQGKWGSRVKQGEEGWDYALKQNTARMEYEAKCLQRCIDHYAKRAEDWEPKALPGE